MLGLGITGPPAQGCFLGLDAREAVGLVTRMASSTIPALTECQAQGWSFSSPRLTEGVLPETLSCLGQRRGLALGKGRSREWGTTR